MNRTHLTAFHAVAESGSFVAGARRLLVGQPALSSHVADLEASLKTALFERLPRGVRLTEAGQCLLGYARRIDGMEREAEQAISELRGLASGSIRIGASTTVGAYLLPRLIGRFKKSYPAIRITLDIGNTADIQQRLADAALDLSITEGFVSQPTLLAETVFRDELVLITGPDHPFVRRRKVAARLLNGEPFLLREPGSGTRAVVEQALARRRVKLHQSMSIGSTEAIKQAVIAGLGVAIVSRMTIDREVAASALRIIPMSDLSIVRSIQLVLVKGRPHSPSTQALLPLLRKELT